MYALWTTHEFLIRLCPPMKVVPCQEIRQMGCTEARLNGFFPHARLLMTRLPGTRCLLVLAFLFGMSPRTTSAGVVNSILLQWRAQAEKCEDSDRVDDITMVH